MAATIETAHACHLAGVHVALVGRLAGMAKRDVSQLIRQHGGMVVEPGDSTAHLIVIGEDLAVSADSAASPLFDDATQAAIEAGQIEAIGESEFWQTARTGR